MKRVLYQLLVLMFLLAFDMVNAGTDPDLIFYFTFEQIDGEFIKDQSGNGHHGRIIGKVKINNAGKRGNALELDGLSYLDLDGPNFPQEHIPRDAITLCAWVKCKKTGDHHEIFNARASDQTWLIHPEVRSEGNFRWLLRSDGGATIFDIRAGTVSWDEWTHFAGVYDGREGILYINGAVEAKNPGGAKIAKDWGSGARIGRTIDEARPFNGLMDDLCLWKKALTAEQIKIVMENGPDALFAKSVSPTSSITITWGKLKSY